MPYSKSIAAAAGDAQPGNYGSIEPSDQRMVSQTRTRWAAAAGEHDQLRFLGLWLSKETLCRMSGEEEEPCGRSSSLSLFPRPIIIALHD